MVQIDSSTEQHQAFLHGLAFDDDLRARLVADPAATLSRFGIAVDGSELPETISLPPAVALRTTLEAAIVDKAHNKPIWMPFLLDD